MTDNCEHRLVEGGITGVILNTHHGEGLHNCTGERKQFLDTAVETLRGKGTHVLVECSRESLWETVEKVDEAYKGGAEWGVISVPRVYGDVLRLEDVFGYFKQVRSKLFSSACRGLLLSLVEMMWC